MLRAANYAGKAINITQTTAGHAMSYKITTLFGTPHGHAAAICVEKLWPFMLTHLDLCVDSRGTEYVAKMFVELSALYTGNDAVQPEAAPMQFAELMDRLGLKAPEGLTDEQLKILVESVNPVRLKNNPIELDKNSIRDLYKEIFNKKCL